MEPIINLEEHIGKTVGRRTPPRDSFAYGMKLQETVTELSKTFKHEPMPRGVFRFHSHEEADAWMMKYRTRKKQG